MATFFRMQGQGHTLEAMQQYRSWDGGANPESGDGETLPGLACCDNVSALQMYAEAWAGPETEIVIFRGQRIADIYDGVVAYPLEIVERVSVDEFLADDRFFDYEE